MMSGLQRSALASTTPHLTDAEARAAARAIVNLFHLWSVSDTEARDLLGGLSSRTWSSWKAGNIGRIGRDLETRLSLYLGIHGALRLVFGNDGPRLYGWMRRENAAFGGRSALEIIRNGQMLDLWRVRQYLDAQSTGD
ncbi:MbcA/ParS/Xre antitoxin family protein [Tabrizicola sp.]|jgi:hypothetical protein|uniref:MbcA/ParS/Xre antitoxin family protein n=1 Tax=Tabrizicola sp. TaxID=2005166 RepID=UPI0035ADB1A9